MATTKSKRRRRPIPVHSSFDRPTEKVDYAAKWVSSTSPLLSSTTTTASYIGIDADTVLAEAEQCIAARQQVIANLRAVGDQLRQALAQVEQQHEVLTSGYNPPMANSAVAVSAGTNRLR